MRIKQGWKHPRAALTYARPQKRRHFPGSRPPRRRVVTDTAQSTPRSPRGSLQTHQDSLSSVAGALSSLGSAAHLPGTALALPTPQHRATRTALMQVYQQKGSSPSSRLAGHSTAPHRKACRRHKAPVLPLQSCNLVLPGADNTVYPTTAPVPVAHIDRQDSPVSRGWFWEIITGAKP